MNTLAQIGDYVIRLVDGEEIRNHDPDFHGYGHHFTNPDIPEKEVWLDLTANHQELLFFLLRALFELELHEQGLRDEEISSKAKQLDMSLRVSDPIDALKVRSLLTIGDKTVWLVRGDEVRRFYPNFEQGGNGYRYPFIPKNEIWVEEHLPELDRIFTLLHELYEVSLMSGGLTYDPAHEQATGFEKSLRDLVQQ